jgi:catechol 2,3-dioxygenase-like lactoylglutathione lyase family enzyme
MLTNGVSHIAVGVRDMDASLRFYRDLLGFEVVRDEVQATQGTVLPALYQEPHDQRRVATLYWKRPPRGVFGLIRTLGQAGQRRAYQLDQIGIHHYAFWVENLPQVYEELKAKGADFVVPPTVTKTKDGNFNSTFLRDPDGILVQLDELVED